MKIHSEINSFWHNFRAVSEEKFLHQIHAEEQFGPVHKTGEEDKKKMLASKKAAIGFTYEDSTPSGGGVASTSLLSPTMPVEATEEDDSDSDIDLGKFLFLSSLFLLSFFSLSSLFLLSFFYNQIRW